MKSEYKAGLIATALVSFPILLCIGVGVYPEIALPIAAIFMGIGVCLVLGALWYLIYNIARDMIEDFTTNRGR